MQHLREEILSIVNHADYKAMKPKMIAKRLGLSGDEAETVRKTVKKMVREGLLAYGSNHMVLPVANAPRVAPSPSEGRAGEGGEAGTDADDNLQGDTPPLSPPHQGEGDQSNSKRKKKKSNRDPNHIVGAFRRMEAGFGFVRPEGTQRVEGRDADIFIPANASGDAASGDTVSVRLSHRGRGGKMEGHIIEVVTRATNRFVGTYFEQGGMGMVQIDGKLFAQAIYVGDPGAKGVQPDDKVVIEMVRFPSHVHDGEGVLIEVLGGRGLPGVDTLSIMHEYSLPGPFAEDALEEARAQAEKFDESIGTESSGLHRQDITNETIITIDPVTARDFDDAISLTQINDHLGNPGHWILGVHIADVSHFVQPKTALDREAKERATSVYLPDRVIPMLPEIISNNLASLQPDRVRYAITARIEFTADGTPIGTEVFKSAIKSRRRFTYEEVDEYLQAKGLVERSSKDKKPAQAALHDEEAEKFDKKPPAPAPAQHVKATGAAPPHLKLTADVDSLLERMFTLAMKLRERRFRRGALELNRPELEIDLDKNGRVTGAHLEINTESHQIIEEFMLAANEAVAEKLFDDELIFLRRVHGAPDPRKLKSLTAFVGELGIKTDSLESRFALQKLLKDVEGDPREHAINYATLRSMQRAVYSPEEEGHFALASDCYCHFTSPIRRYPDLTVHRLFDDLAQGKKPVQSLEALFALGDHCSDREQRATEAERELNKVKLLNYFADKIGTEMNGYITGVESFGLFITGSDIPAEGFIPIAALTDDYYRYDRAGHVVHGLRGGNSYRLGDAVRIAVAAVDVDRRELDFRLIGRIGKSSGPAPTGRNRRGSGAPHGPEKPGKKKGPRKGGKGRK
ncbi:ribonuclease R family protein [Lacipirellula parvula]|uniref:Ribonuclease R n=1 Tax=Lacipirellula parvula TaxID=2650471 RepID=A0A5K7XF99_9BACT|nr:RNB domain-containing ribonuclease [Lacipirellula parvula]BBO35480.1 3'-to-5' exoribonuclease RNase R [Lacipirellula parvula]